MPCSCPLKDSGWCPSHRRPMGETDRERCASGEPWYGLFQEGVEGRPETPGGPRPRAVSRPSRGRAAKGPSPVGNDGRRCVHRGDATGEEVPCGCGGRRRTAVYVCTVRGRCSDRQATVGSVTWCRWCDDFTAKSAPPAART